MLTYPFNVTGMEEFIWISIHENHVRVYDCELLCKKSQIKETVEQIYKIVEQEGYVISRSKKNMCGELYLHIIFAKLGLFYNSAKHADLEYNQDSRWLVRIGSKILSILF